MEKEKTFLGQPRGLSTLFFTEMWERFSYYGMRAILVYFMYDAVTNGGLGLPKSTAVAIMSIYGSLVYMSSIVGGWISDRLLGSNKSVFYGGIPFFFFCFQLFLYISPPLYSSAASDVYRRRISI